MGTYKLRGKFNQMQEKILSNVLAIVPTADFADSYLTETPLKYIRLRCKIRLAHEKLSCWSGDNMELTFLAEDVLTFFEELMLLNGTFDGQTQVGLKNNYKYQLECALNLIYVPSDIYRKWLPGEIYEGNGFTLEIVPGLGLLATGKVRLDLNLQEVAVRVSRVMQDAGLPVVCINGRYFYTGKPIWTYAEAGEVTADIKDGWLVSRRDDRYFLCWENSPSCMKLFPQAYRPSKILARSEECIPFIKVNGQDMQGSIQQSLQGGAKFITFESSSGKIIKFTNGTKRICSSGFQSKR